jgi:hypothetical protein
MAGPDGAAGADVAAGAAVAAGAEVGAAVGVACGLQPVTSRTRATRAVIIICIFFIFSPLKALNEPTQESTLNYVKLDCFHLNIGLEKFPLHPRDCALKDRSQTGQVHWQPLPKGRV